MLKFWRDGQITTASRLKLSGPRLWVACRGNGDRKSRQRRQRYASWSNWVVRRCGLVVAELVVVRAGGTPAVRLLYFVFVDYAFFHYERYVIESGDVF
jgi:hypothetical protein